MPVVTRFAPSPTGPLHLGHAFAAWVAWSSARGAGGRFLLRLEDIDPDRCRPEHARAAREDLTWLGLLWDGAVRTQSAHFAEYAAALASLRARELIYPCFCSRAEISREIAAAATAPHAPDGALRYPGTCRGLARPARLHRIERGDAHAWRLDMRCALADTGQLSFVELGAGAEATVVRADPEPFGDVVLARRGAPAGYHLCVTHDDAQQGVSLVTRGVDLLPATHLHRLLQHLMGWPTPTYQHHRLLLNDSGTRLSKRAGARALSELRALGWSAEDVIQKVASVSF